MGNKSFLTTNWCLFKELDYNKLMLAKRFLKLAFYNRPKIILAHRHWKQCFRHLAFLYVAVILGGSITQLFCTTHHHDIPVTPDALLVHA